MDDVPATLAVTLNGVLHEVVLTNHARQRIAEMECDLEEVARAALSPSVWYRGSDTSGRTRVQRCDGSDIALVCAEEGRVVVTVLWNRIDDYQREQGQDY